MESCYFTALDDASAIGARDGGPLGRGELPTVPARGVITVLAIPRLIALARGGEPVLDPHVVDHLWPRMPDDPAADPSWRAEPVVERLSDALRDDLAAIDERRAGELALRWAPEIRWPVAECEELVVALVALARSAREEGRPLYNRYAL